MKGSKLLITRPKTKSETKSLSKQNKRAITEKHYKKQNKTKQIKIKQNRTRQKRKQKQT